MNQLQQKYEITLNLSNYDVGIEITPLSVLTKLLEEHTLRYGIISNSWFCKMKITIYNTNVSTPIIGGDTLDCIIVIPEPDILDLTNNCLNGKFIDLEAKKAALFLLLNPDIRRIAPLMDNPNNNSIYGEDVKEGDVELVMSSTLCIPSTQIPRKANISLMGIKTTSEEPNSTSTIMFDCGIVSGFKQGKMT